MTETLVVETQTVAIEKLHPNKYNPNRMDARTYEAERESLRLYGFIDPVTARPHPEIDGEFEIVDGEHRARAAAEEGMTEVPVIVLDLDDVAAKKLTIILNETRGNADVVLLGQLLSDLDASLENVDELSLGLPYSRNELDHFFALGRTDWDTFRTDDNAGAPPPVDTQTFSVDLPAGMHDQFVAWLEIIEREKGLSRPDALVETVKLRAQELNQGS